MNFVDWREWIIPSSFMIWIKENDCERYWNDTILYVYNRSNPISDDKVNQQLQWDIHAEISNKPSFNKIENYK
jgi:hypothetical protein